MTNNTKYTGDCIPTPQPLSEMDIQTEKIDSNLDSLQYLIGELEKRLAPILHDDYVKESNKEACDKGVALLSPLGNTLSNLGDKVVSNSARLGDLINRLAI